MAGITNRPQRIEEQNQQRVEKQKNKLPDIEQVDQRDHPVAKDKANEPVERDRISETGAGRGPEHEGH
jgi:hypothetical protein